MATKKNNNVFAAWLLAALGWAIPGAGHLAQGRWRRGLLALVTVWGLMSLGFMFGGRFFDLTSAREGLLMLAYGVFNVGNGLAYLFGYLSGAGFGDGGGELAKIPTFEHANTLIMVAGLLNFLVALDAFDIKTADDTAERED